MEKKITLKPILLITRRREPLISSKDQRIKLTYPRLNAPTVIRWVSKKINVMRIQEIRREIGDKKISPMKLQLRRIRLKNEKSKTYTTNSFLAYPS